MKTTTTLILRSQTIGPWDPCRLSKTQRPLCSSAIPASLAKGKSPSLPKLPQYSFFETISSQSNQTKETRDSNMMYYYYWQNYQISHVLKDKGESHPHG